METGKRHRRGVIINPQNVPVPKKEVVKKPITPKKTKIKSLIDDVLNTSRKIIKNAKEKLVLLLEQIKPLKNRSFNFIHDKWSKLLLYTKDYRHEVFLTWRSLQKRLVVSLLVASVLSGVVSVSAMTLDVGYEIIINKESIGIVKTIDDAKRLYETAISNGKEYLKQDDFTIDAPSYSLRLLKKGDYTSDVEAIEAFLSTSDKFIDGYAVVADDKMIFSMIDEKTAYEVLSSYKSQFVNENTIGEAVFDKNVKVVKKSVPINSILSSEGALYVIENNAPFKVITAERKVETKSIPYDVSEKQDSSMYKGEKKVITKGQKGEAVVEAIIYKENGLETSQIVTNETIKSEPTQEVLLVGSKEKPKGFATGTFLKPYNGTLSSRYGRRWGKMHEGIDLAGKVGDTIKAADGGKVIYAGWMSGYGKLVKINHGNGFVTAYGHLNSISVSVGDTVEKGNKIGTLGNTGKSTGPHLHFEVIKNGKPVDPLSYLK